MYLHNELTVFVISSGNNPNYNNCLNALYNQTVQFKIDIIKDYCPMSKAFQEMLDRCTTEFYIEIDEDMILDSNAIEIMYQEIIKTNEKISMICFQLYDVHFDLKIYGVKVYKLSIFKNYPYNVNSISCEVEQLDRMKIDGYTYDLKEIVLGKHSPLWSDELIYDRYFNLMEKFKEFKYVWTEFIPKKLFEKFQKEPTELNFYALLGVFFSIIKREKIQIGEKNFTNVRTKELARMKSFLELPITSSFYLTSKCNFNCSFCRRQHRDLVNSPDMTVELVGNILRRFPTISSICLCFSGDTKIKLVNGTHQTLEEIFNQYQKDNKKVEVFSRDSNFNIVPGEAIPLKTRTVDKYIKLTLDNNKVIKCTEDHLFMVKNYDKNDNRIKFIDNLAYIEAKDLNEFDSLMPLYTEIVEYYKKSGRIEKREFIHDEYTDEHRGHIYKIFAEFYYGSTKGKVIHHKNFDSMDNTKENLQLLNSNQEHIKIHANTAIRKEISGRVFKTEKAKKIRTEHNQSEKMRKRASDFLKKFHKTEKGKKATQLGLRMMTEGAKISNKNPIYILKRRKGKVRNIVQKILCNNLEVNEENYNKVWSNGQIKFKTIFEKGIFKDIEEMINYTKTYNHKLIKKEFIEEQTEMYCLSVEKFGNFALSAGVFVKNCGLGEPLMNDNFIRILHYLKNNSIFVGLITNGSLIKENFEKIRIKPPNYISISLNAPNAIVHQQINGTNTFNIVIEGIELLVKANIETYLSYVCTKQNLSYIPEFLKLAKSLNVKSVHLHNLLPHFKDEDEEQFWSLVLTKEDENKILKLKADPNASIVSRFPVLIDRNEIRRECKFPWKTINFDGNGFISICPSVCEPQKENGHIEDNVLWHNDYCMDLRDSILEVQKDHCRKCFRNWSYE